MFDNLSSVDEVYSFKDVISVCDELINPKSVICCEPLMVPAGTEPPPLAEDEIIKLSPSWLIVIFSPATSEPLNNPLGSCSEPLIIPLPTVS